MAKLTKLLLSIILVLLVTACGVSPQVMAQERMFLDLSLEFLGEYQLPKQTFEDTPIGGLSGLTYDRKRDRFYAISDDRSQYAPARFYTLKLKLKENPQNKPRLEQVTVEGVTLLKNEQGETYAPLSTDTEGIALSPRDTVFISSEGSPKGKILPFIREFDRASGQLKLNLRIPQRYLPNAPDSPPRGVQENLGFEALTIGANSTMSDDPFRLFTATELALVQDAPNKTPEENSRIRLMHYVINPIGEPVLVAEHLYLLDKPPGDTISWGLSELLALQKEGYFLSLERTLGLSGFGAKIFQVINANATDTSESPSLQGELTQVQPLKKKLLLDLGKLGIDLDNLEGMTLGPNLPDGSQTLLLVSDDNFKKKQVTQFLLFRLTNN
jgi:hypothetical protein